MMNSFLMSAAKLERKGESHVTAVQISDLGNGDHRTSPHKMGIQKTQT